MPMYAPAMSIPTGWSASGCPQRPQPRTPRTLSRQPSPRRCWWTPRAPRGSFPPRPRPETASAPPGALLPDKRRGTEPRMPGTLYQVTFGEQIVRVEVRRTGDRLFVSIDDRPEQPVQLDQVHGALRSLVLGERHLELLAALDDDDETVRLAIGGLEYRAEV